MKKVARLSQELSIPILANCNEETQNHMQAVIKELNLKAPFSFSSFEEWDDFMLLSKKVNKTDILMLISEQHEAFSYHSIVDNLPNKLGKHFKDNSKILVYPK